MLERKTEREEGGTERERERERGRDFALMDNGEKKNRGGEKGRRQIDAA